jgi:hypothetical protein
VNGPKHDLSRDVMGPVMGLRVEKVPGLRVHETFEGPSLSHFGKKSCSHRGNPAYRGHDVAAGTFFSTRRAS